jgi:hypothetical protein
LNYALSQSPWYVRLAWYAAADLWGSITAGLAALNGVIPGILLYLNDNPDAMQKFEAMIPSPWRWFFAAVLAVATVTTSVMSIVKKAKS